MHRPPLPRAFRFGDVARPTFTRYLRNFLPFTLIVAIVQIPVMILFFFAPESADGAREEPVTARLWWLVWVGAGLGLGYVATGALSYGVFQELRGQRASMGRCLAVGFARLFPVLGVALVVGLATFVGLLLCVFPAFIVQCMLWVAVPAAVVERAGVTVAVQRSLKLTRGHRWTIVVVILLFWVIGAVVEEIGYALAGLRAGGTDSALWIIGLPALLLSMSVGAALPAVASAVGYHDLRVVVEGMDTEELAAVFD